MSYTKEQDELLREINGCIDIAYQQGIKKRNENIIELEIPSIKEIPYGECYEKSLIIEGLLIQFKKMIDAYMFDSPYLYDIFEDFKSQFIDAMFDRAVEIDTNKKEKEATEYEAMIQQQDADYRRDCR